MRQHITFTRNRLRRAHRDRRGAIVLEWVCILPLYTVVITVILQLTVIGMGSLVARYAAFSAGRAAMVGLPEHTKENAVDAAALALSAIAPNVSESLVGRDQLGARVGESIRNQGQPWSYGHAGSRTAAARRAMEIDITPDEILGGPETLRVSLRYPLRLAIPFAAAVLGEHRVEGGIAGYYIDLTAQAELRSHGSRVAVDRGSLGSLHP